MGVQKGNLQSLITQGTMVRIILLIGVQGTGKTWVFKQLIERYLCNSKKKIGTIRYHTNGELVIAGKYDNSMFEGSDKLSMAVMSDYDLFMQLNEHNIILLEGDRFTNSKVIENELYPPFVIRINNDGEWGRAYRGSNQSKSVIQRMQTRVNNITPHMEVTDSNEALKIITNLIDQYEIR